MLIHKNIYEYVVFESETTLRALKKIKLSKK